MKAAYFTRHGGIDALEVGDLPAPSPAPADAVVDVAAAALNHLDLHVLRGIPGLKLLLPHIGGSDIAGTIAELGSEVEGWEPGDRVVVDPGVSCGRCPACEADQAPLCPEYRIIGEHLPGGFAERVVVPARNLHGIPDGDPFAAAAAAPLVFQTAWRALMSRARLCEGETVLITGASGGVSTAAIQIARRAGATVLAVTGGADKVRRVRDLGADHVIDRTEVDFAREVRRITDKRGVDVVLDSVGEAMWEGCIRSLAPDGRLITYGGTSGPEVKLDVRRVFWRQLRIIGSTMGSRSEFREVMDLVFAGELSPVIDQTMSLDAAREAYERLEAGAQFGKIVLLP
ncbi:MAG: zinc-binding dehydrogenase [Gemmatimonadales bacterium]